MENSAVNYDYIKAKVSDNFIQLKPVEIKEVPPPARILIVSPTANGVDQILDLLAPLSKN